MTLETLQYPLAKTEGIANLPWVYTQVYRGLEHQRDPGGNEWGWRDASALPSPTSTTGYRPWCPNQTAPVDGGQNGQGCQK